MGFIKLNIPILVRQLKADGNVNYQLQPLFVGRPSATHRRFELALSQLKKELKHYFRGFSLTRENKDQVLWYMFNPDLQYQSLDFSLNLGKQYIKGRFGAVTFELKGLHFASLPAFNNYMFMLGVDKNTGKVNSVDQIRRVVRQLLKSLRENDSDFEAEDYFATKGEFVTSTTYNIHISDAPFSFEQEETNWFFSQQNAGDKFDGATEIEKVGNELNSAYPAELSRAYYQDEQVERLYRIIFGEENTPIVIVGPEGVGKHTLLQEVVYRYMKANFKDNDLYLQKIWHIDPTRIIAGMKYVGWWQKRMEAILKYVRDRHSLLSQKSTDTDKIVIDNVVALTRIGKSSQNTMTLSDLLKPYLEKRQLQLILIATPEEWKVLQEKDRRFSDLFQVMRLKEPDQQTAAKMVLKQRNHLEVIYDCEFTIQAIMQLFVIQRNYLRGKALPGSISKLMNQLAVKYRQQMIDLPEVRDEFELFSGLNDKIFDSDYTFSEEEIQQAIASRLVGQEEAVRSLASAIHLIKSKLVVPGKPMASFLFIGPTGVGKTQASKVLSEYITGGEQHLMRFDMNEYIDAGAVHRLIGDEHHPEGHLTGKVRYQPFGVVLFDEIEKAHPKVHDLLLQVLDDGRLTDSLGKTVDFTGTIIIMTSNVGARQAATQLGFDAKQRDQSDVYRKAVENRFRPEFINRIDEIVIFKSLQLPHILSIARLQIKELLKRDGFVRRTTILNISTDALEWVARRGYDEKMGGRALKRQIEKDLTTLSAEQLISTNTDNPIIFDILFKNETLVPQITPMTFEEAIEDNWMPQLPDQNRGKGFFNRLLRRVEGIERKIRHLEESREDLLNELIIIGNEKGESLDWQYYHFKDKIAATKQRIVTLSLGFKDKHFSEGPAIPLRLKRGNINPRRDWATRVIKETTKDRLFQQEALEEINEYYQYASAQFDSLETEFIQSYLDVFFIELASKAFLRQETDKITLKFESCINGWGKQDLESMMSTYVRLLENMDFQFKRHPNKNRHEIEVEGHAIYDLFKEESGIHLFCNPNQNPLPIRLDVLLGRSRKKSLSQLKVVRIYNGGSTLTDLRTGFTNTFNISPEELKLLLFAGIPKFVRNEFNHR